eukprot:TRINITY_DN66286_c0_g1_i1.p2 TRINITY_DN66286_c0_g1~~TRINITY_DN66286_c0_g1_i1.p2  ORF type:complete len:405 (+),score=192.71 TRINITY_DN66286_c0_g1_i1:90-1304(+)
MGGDMVSVKLQESVSEEDLDYEAMELDIDLDQSFVTESLFGFDMSQWIKKKEAPFIRLRDKITFLVGVLNYGLIAFLAGGHHSFLPWVYLFKYPVMIMWRYLSYKKMDWHYFLLDFCYYANLLVLVSLFGFPENHHLFVVAFCVVNGPLLWAVPLFRNSLVFHSVDKITSCFIHISPPVVMWAARWYLNPTTDFKIHVCKAHDTGNPADGCETTWADTFGYPVAFFAGHQVLYYLIIHLFLRKSIKQNPRALTTYRYLVKSNRRSPTFRLVSVCGAPFRRLVFSLYYTVFAAVTILPTFLMYQYFWVNFFCVAGCIVVAVWNGANFYIEVFSRKYAAKYHEFKRRSTITGKRPKVEDGKIIKQAAEDNDDNDDASSQKKLNGGNKSSADEPHHNQGKRGSITAV